VNWITLWQIALLYLPGYSIPMIFAVLTILSYLWDRRRYGPSILGFYYKAQSLVTSVDNYKGRSFCIFRVAKAGDTPDLS